MGIGGKGMAEGRLDFVFSDRVRFMDREGPVGGGSRTCAGRSSRGR